MMAVLTMAAMEMKVEMIVEVMSGNEMSNALSVGQNP